MKAVDTAICQGQSYAAQQRAHTTHCVTLNGRDVLRWPQPQAQQLISALAAYFL